MEDIGNAADANGDGDGREEGGRGRGASDAELGVSGAWTLTSCGTEPEHYSASSFPLFTALLLLQCRSKKVVEACHPQVERTTAVRRWRLA